MMQQCGLKFLHRNFNKIGGILCNLIKMKKDVLTETLVTRLQHLERGTRGKILNCWESVDFDTLFSHNVIINLSCLSDDKDKLLIMSLLMQALYEYRTSYYMNDTEYRESVQQNECMHLAVIEDGQYLLNQSNGETHSDTMGVFIAELFRKIQSETSEYGQRFALSNYIACC